MCCMPAIPLIDDIRDGRQRRYSAPPTGVREPYVVDSNAGTMLSVLRAPSPSEPCLPEVSSRTAPSVIEESVNSFASAL